MEFYISTLVNGQHTLGITLPEAASGAMTVGSLAGVGISAKQGSGVVDVNDVIIPPNGDVITTDNSPLEIPRGATLGVPDFDFSEFINIENDIEPSGTVESTPAFSDFLNESISQDKSRTF